MPVDDITDQETDRRGTATNQQQTDDGPTDPSSGVPGARVDGQGTHRLYGAERAVHPAESDVQGLLTLRELRLVEHADRFDDDQQRALERVLEDRVEQFVEMEWPILRETHPEYADRLRDTVCGSSDE